MTNPTITESALKAESQEMENIQTKLVKSTKNSNKCLIRLETEAHKLSNISIEYIDPDYLDSKLKEVYGDAPNELRQVRKIGYKWLQIHPQLRATILSNIIDASTTAQQISQVTELFLQPNTLTLSIEKAEQFRYSLRYLIDDMKSKLKNLQNSQNLIDKYRVEFRGVKEVISHRKSVMKAYASTFQQRKPDLQRKKNRIQNEINWRSKKIQDLQIAAGVSPAYNFIPFFGTLAFIGSVIGMPIEIAKLQGEVQSYTDQAREVERELEVNEKVGDYVDAQTDNVNKANTLLLSMSKNLTDLQTQWQSYITKIELIITDTGKGDSGALIKAEKELDQQIQSSKSQSKESVFVLVSILLTNKFIKTWGDLQNLAKNLELQSSQTGATVAHTF